MALIKCPHCGGKMSDRAPRCPHCAYEPSSSVLPQTQQKSSATEPPQPNTHNEPVSPDNIDSSHYELPKTDAPENQSDGVDEVDISEYIDENDGSTMKRVLFILALVLIIVCIIGYVYYTNRQSKLAEEQRIEALRQDSIAAVNREIARQDSIRRDSINFVNFTSPDLRFFELRGKVKSVTYSGPSLPFNAIFKGTRFNFDQDGNLINKSQLFDLLEPDEYLYHWEYNRNKYPTEAIYAAVSPGSPSYHFKYNSNGKLIEAFNSFGSAFTENNCYYDNKGNLKSTEYEERHNGGAEIIINTSVKISETDKWGNWTKRTFISKGHDKYDAFDEDAIPQNGYRVIDEDGYKVFKKQINKTTTQTRVITYY